MKERSYLVYARRGWRPRVDVYRSADGWLVKLELAGMAEQDVHIQVQQDFLLVEGQRRDWCISDAREPLSMEITYDLFRRQVRLPCALESVELRT
ncbi:MAG: Hsp20/alpha crystallin family protein [Chromatiaceae bacterium]|nr:Hsp20/alpha crystallin family protein [Chromatiaceae bacterium]